MAGSDAERAELAPDQDIHSPETTVAAPPVFSDERPPGIPVPTPAPPAATVPPTMLVDVEDEDDRSKRNLALWFAAAAFLLAVAALAVGLLGLGPEKELGPNSVTETQLAPGSVGADQVDPALAESLKGEPGPEGAPGARGPRGPRGPKGPSGALPAITLESSDVKGITADFATASVQCPNDSRALGGGGTVTDAEGAVTPATLSITEPLPNRTGWRVEARRSLDSSSDAAPWSLKAWVVCQAGAEQKPAPQSDTQGG